jgi:hypothetical protein
VRAAGVPELVCESPEAFVQRAIALAGPDRLSLRAYRERLIAGRDTCTLFDIDLLARKLESLYSAMVAIHARGETPTPNLTNLDAYLSVGASFDHDAIEIGQASDYHAIYATGLAAIHRHRPLAPDNRIWTRTQIDAARTKPAPATARSAA